MKYKCLDCKHIFLHVAKSTITIPEQYTVEKPENVSFRLNSTSSTEKSICPYCGGFKIDEYTEAEEVANVYVYELTTGPQVELDKLLAQGFKIVNRYSKQYHLEKPKVAPKDAQPEFILDKVEVKL